MIKKKTIMLLAAVGTMTVSCVDNNYKLSDMDTTMGIKINNLTIPLNVDSLVLDQVLDPEKDSKVKKQLLADGTEIYAIVEEGTFNSRPIKVESFSTDAPEITPIATILKRDNTVRIRSRKGIEKDETLAVCYPISKDATPFTASSNVDKSIQSIKRIGVNADYNIEFDVFDPNLIKKVDYIRFEDLNVKMPKGLEGNFFISNGDEKIDVTKCYDIDKGALDLTKFEEKYEGKELQLKIEKGKLDFNIHVDAINIEKAKDEIKFENGKFELNSSMSVLAGNVVVYGDELCDGLTLNDLPNEVNYVCSPELSEIEVSEFTGLIQYEIEDININPISLNDIPDMLSQDSTNIKLANPQIYLRLNNPLASDNLYAEAGLAMIAKRKDGSNKTVMMGENKLKMDKAYNVFCLTDGEFSKEQMHPEYKDAENKQFKGFSEILSGNGANGLPDNIEIDVVDPQIPGQRITNFELGKEIDKVEGTYLFYAPLALKDESSFIIYQDTLDGWYDETLEKLSIDKVVVKADVNSEVPLNLELSFSPIDVNGKKIKGVKSNTVKLSATKGLQPIEINMEGDIKNLDGIIVRAKLIGANGETIAPSQTINFKKLKVAVTGTYIDEF